MKNKIDQVRQRTMGYWQVDGLSEIGFGFVCLLLGLYFFAQASLPHESLLYKILDMGFVFLIIGSGLVAGRIISALKQRITYPRTGYISYGRKKGSQRWPGALLAMAMGMVIGGLLAGAPPSFTWMPAITGFIFTSILLFIGYRAASSRFYLLGAISLALGTALSVAGIGDILGLGLYYMLISLALAISGAVTLWFYLRHNPLPSEDEQEGVYEG